MKKSLYLLPLIVLLAGCGAKNNPDQNPQPVALKEPAQIQADLSNSGWDVQDTSAASFHVWEQLAPSAMILAEDPAGQVLIIGQFDDEQKASDAYRSSVPLTDTSITIEDTDTWKQALIPLDEGQGFWLFRQAGSDVMGGWMADASSKDEFVNIFNSFLASGAPQTDPEAPAEGA